MAGRFGASRRPDRANRGAASCALVDSAGDFGAGRGLAPVASAADFAVVTGFRTPAPPPISAPCRAARDPGPGPGEVLRPVDAVRGIEFEVAPARCVGLLGPNGAGKTTTMRMIMGLTTPSAGELRVFGVPVAEPDPPAQGPDRPRAPGEQPRPGPVGPPEPRGLRPLLQPAVGGDRRAHPGAARLPAARRAGRERRQSALRRHEAPPGAGARPDQRSGAGDPGRADHRARPAGAGHDLEAPARSEAPRQDPAAHHPLHGRGAAPVRRDHRDRPRPDPRSRRAAGPDRSPRQRPRVRGAKAAAVGLSRRPVGARGHRRCHPLLHRCAARLRPGPAGGRRLLGTARPTSRTCSCA